MWGWGRWGTVHEQGHVESITSNELIKGSILLWCWSSPWPKRHGHESGTSGTKFFDISTPGHWGLQWLFGPPRPAFTVLACNLRAGITVGCWTCNHQEENVLRQHCKPSLELQGPSWLTSIEQSKVGLKLGNLDSPVSGRPSRSFFPRLCILYPGGCVWMAKKVCSSVDCSWPLQSSLAESVGTMRVLMSSRILVCVPVHYSVG